MSLFNPRRDQVRRFFFDTWKKYRLRQSLTPLEALALQVIEAHPEYHVVLDAPEKYLEQEYFPETGETNPFLHMSLHLSVLEQLSIDQPSGIVAAYGALLERRGDAQAAQHALMDCLAETVWRSQRDGRPPDAAAYLACMREKATMPN